ncbi:hypothetical protein F2P79_022814 [Pimephales promelas]|nr:hypothetical protein F2P79_022814 [Pimephales promelas]
MRALRVRREREGIQVWECRGREELQDLQDPLVKAGQEVLVPLVAPVTPGAPADPVHQDQWDPRAQPDTATRTPASEPGFDDLTDTDVRVVQPYGPEVEEDGEPYGSYGPDYQPNYPPPRPVQEEPRPEEEELRSPGVQRHTRHTRSLADPHARRPRRRQERT